MSANTTPPATPPRSDSLPFRSSTLSPRTTCLASRSPRLGQQSFDQSVAAAGSRAASPFSLGEGQSDHPSPVAAFMSPSSSPRSFAREEEEMEMPMLRMQPRQLFVDEEEGLDLVSRADPEQEEEVEKDGAGWAEQGAKADEVVRSTTATRPPKLDLSQSTQPSSKTIAEGVPTSTLRLSTATSSSTSTTSCTPPPAPKKPTIRPTLGLMFSLSPKLTHYTILLPATLLSIICGLFPPYMTDLVGKAFQAFTDYTLATSNPSLTPELLKQAQDTLVHTVRDATIKLCVLAALTFFVSTGMVYLWVVNGERAVRTLRMEVFKGVGKRELAWFDLGMGATEEEGEEVDGEEKESSQGAGGLMGRFTKETDDVRLGASQNIGLFLQYLTSFIACLILSFYRDWKLTFVILASFPIVTLIVSITERFSGPLYQLDRSYSTKSSSRLDRVLGAMPTVKAFNADDNELASFGTITRHAQTAYNRLHFVWGIRTGATQFIMLSMFVQGFWFGAFLVRTGKSTAAQVNTCFWACLIAATYLQQCVPMLVTIEKGKVAAAGLLELARELQEEPQVVLDRSSPPPPSSALSTLFNLAKKDRQSRGQFPCLESSEPFALRPSSTADADLANSPLSPHPFQLTSPTLANTPHLIPLSATQPSRRGRKLAARAMAKLRPQLFTGELSLRNVTFHYPTRPHPAPPALQNVSFYLAAKETTYIVGGSGSGKSTVGSLLLGLYKPEEGRVEVDEQGSEWIDEEWLRGHVACVSQGASVLFDGTVHDNVAIGIVGQIQEDGTRREAKDVTRAEVVAACQGALIHDFIRNLPEGYDTWLSGEKSASLSGGQRQRLAIARTWLRDPTVLILDEATSALDATSRLLVSEAIKVWRQHRTTIIITHDLSPIDPHDFVYVMAEGKVVEQGYRVDLESNHGGPFHSLAHIQATHVIEELNDSDSVEDLGWEVVDEGYPSVHSTPRIEISDADDFRLPAGGFLIAPPVDLGRASRELKEIRRASATFVERQENRLTSTPPRTPPRPPSNRSRPSSHTSLTTAAPPHYDFSHYSSPDNRRGSSMSMAALELAGHSATVRRPGGVRIKHKTMLDGGDLQKKCTAMQKKEYGGAEVTIHMAESGPPRAVMTLTQLVRRYYPTIPSKWLLFLGFFFCIVVGACTPIFASLLSKLLANLSNPNASTTTSLLVLLIAFVDGASTFLKYYLLERCGMGWIVALRRDALGKVIKQDKSFFDQPENSTSSLCHSIIKDTEDARLMVGTIIGQIVVVVSMLSIGLIWAMVSGWELTLVGLGLAPVFVIATRLQAGALSVIEARNKVLREDVSKRFYQTVANVRAIRSMSIEPVFLNKFEQAAAEAYAGGLKAAPFAGMGSATGNALTYAADALMFYVGAILVIKGRYDFQKMTQVFALIIFSISFAAQVMVYLPGIAKATQAAMDFWRLLDLSTETKEAEGRMTFPIKGDISFDSVNFAYPTRPDVPILRNTSFSVKAGECVGIVGASGSGKSTVTALLQRLYEPTTGSILLDGRPLSRVDTRYLRDHVAVVSQHPALFDMTVAENIAYGHGSVEQEDVVRAAKAAYVHDFILSLPKGYETMLGENASLISGGQAQRLQIARALVRPREILILDECTSALDPTNQAAVLETILTVKEGKTTLIVTHKLAIMERCDYLLVMADGAVVESGSVEALKAKGGLFSQLASGGEWEGQ